MQEQNNETGEHRTILRRHLDRLLLPLAVLVQRLSDDGKLRRCKMKLIQGHLH